MISFVEVNAKYKEISKSRLEYVESSPCINESLDEYIYQVGGHGLKSSKKDQILNDGAGILYKPVQNFPKGEMEIKFYQSIFDIKCKNLAVKELKKFIPNFLGLFSCNAPSKENLYIGIEDLLFKFKLPSVADVKIGQKSYEPNVPLQKKQNEISKYKWRESVGFLITGIRVYKPISTFLNRYHGRSLNPEEVYTKGIKVFLGSDAAKAAMLAIHFIINLKNLLDWFKSQKEMSFVASSILMAYENDFHKDVTNGDVMTYGICGSHVLVKLIDFTHVLPVDDYDYNCIYGIESLIKYFERVKSDKEY